MNKTIITNFIRDERERKGITQRDVANATRVSQSAYSQHEMGDFKEIRVLDLEGVVNTIFGVEINILELIEERIRRRWKINEEEQEETVKELLTSINKGLREENDELLKTIAQQRDELVILKSALKNVTELL